MSGGLTVGEVLAAKASALRIVAPLASRTAMHVRREIASFTTPCSPVTIKPLLDRLIRSTAQGESNVSCPEAIASVARSPNWTRPGSASFNPPPSSRALPPLRVAQVKRVDGFPSQKSRIALRPKPPHSGVQEEP